MRCHFLFECGKQQKENTQKWAGMALPDREAKLKGEAQTNFKQHQ